MRRVTQISILPVKDFRLSHPEQVVLDMCAKVERPGVVRVGDPFTPVA